MPTIYDNIENKLHKGLNSCLDKATRADFCIGYFNLWGWNMLLEQVNKLSGACLPDGYGDEEDDSTYYCRVLIGMEKTSIRKCAITLQKHRRWITPWQRAFGKNR